jgi:hypothetical protein
MRPHTRTGGSFVLRCGTMTDTKATTAQSDLATTAATAAAAERKDFKVLPVQASVKIDNTHQVYERLCQYVKQAMSRHNKHMMTIVNDVHFVAFTLPPGTARFVETTTGAALNLNDDYRSSSFGTFEGEVNRTKDEEEVEVVAVGFWGIMKLTPMSNDRWCEVRRMLFRALDDSKWFDFSVAELVSTAPPTNVLRKLQLKSMVDSERDRARDRAVRRAEAALAKAEEAAEQAREKSEDAKLNHDRAVRDSRQAKFELQVAKQDSKERGKCLVGNAIDSSDDDEETTCEMLKSLSSLSSY